MAINPYQSPPIAADDAAAPGREEVTFELTDSLIRYGESKFLLTRCSGRLMLVSLAMIALAIVAIMPWPPIADVPMLFRLIFMMVLTSTVYLASVHHVRKRIAAELGLHGMVDGALVTASHDGDVLRWESPGNRREYPLLQTKLMHTGKGTVVIVDRDAFLFLPKRSAMSGMTHGPFLKSLAKARRQFK